MSVAMCVVVMNAQTVHASYNVRSSCNSGSPQCSEPSLMDHTICHKPTNAYAKYSFLLIHVTFPIVVQTKALTWLHSMLPEIELFDSHNQLYLQRVTELHSWFASHMHRHT